MAVDALSPNGLGATTSGRRLGRVPALVLAAGWFTMPWSRLSIAGNLRLSDGILLVAAAVVFLTSPHGTQQGRIYVPRPARRHLLGIALIAAGLLGGSTTSAQSLAPLVRILAMSLLAGLPLVLLLRVRADSTLLRFLAGAFLGGVMVAVVTAPVLDLATDAQGRWHGLAGHPNELGALVAMTFPLLPVVLRGYKRWFSAALVVALVVGLNGSGSRSGSIATGAVLVVLATLWLRRTPGGLLSPKAVGVAAVAIVAAMLVYPAVSSRSTADEASALGRLSGSESAVSDDGRRELIQSGVEAALSPRAVVGIGYSLERSPHNAFLEAWVAGGLFTILGVLLTFGAAIGRTARSIRRSRPQLARPLSGWFALSAVGWMVSIFFNNAFWARYGWGMLALSTAALVAEQRSIAAGREWSGT